MRRSGNAFTLLELLAAITLLVILGTMLFQVFQQASSVVEIGNARQEVYQYARAALEFLQRELGGSFTGVDSDSALSAGNGIRGMRIYASGTTMGANVKRRAASQGVFFTSGVMARDTRQTYPDGSTNPFFGRDVNCARIAYYLNDCTTKLTDAAVCRSESYMLNVIDPDCGGPFLRNCMFFTIETMSPFPNESPALFRTVDWDSEGYASPGGFQRRRGLPEAIRITFRMTDERRAMLYRWDAADTDPNTGAAGQWRVPGPDGTLTKDYASQEDPIAQTFRNIVFFGRRSD